MEKYLDLIPTGLFAVLYQLSWQANWELVSHRYRKGHGLYPVQAWIFSSLIFSIAQEVFITAKIAFIFTSLSTVPIYDFHIFTVIYSSLHGFMWNQHIDQLAVGLLAELVGRCTGIAEVMSSNPVQAYTGLLWILSGSLCYFQFFRRPVLITLNEGVSF